MASTWIANPDFTRHPCEGAKYPAKKHAQRVASWIKSNGGPSDALIYLEGRSTFMVEDDDQAEPFRQRRNFYYLTGCSLPDCKYLYDIASDKSTLLIPPVDAEQVMWSGMPLLPEDAKAKYDVDDVQTTEKTEQVLHEMLTKQPNVLVIKDRLDVKVFESDGITHLHPKLDFDWLKQGVEQCRVVKDDYEIALLRHANAISSYAHRQVLSSVKKAKNERELNAVFVMHCHANDCKEQSYSCICAAGTNASTLHYVNNDLTLDGKLNLLMDAGAEFELYCADITRTFPLNGKFTKESREIYDLVLRMQTECMGMIREGVLWDDVHLHAHRVAATGLQELGIFKQPLSVDQILDSKVTSRFFPHGLGHYLGMDTHDVGGNADYEDPDPLLCYLRVRNRLPAGAVITNEPGIYFREFPLRQELKDGKWKDIIDESVLDRYWTVGGVRIEDDIVVRKDGCENLTTVSSKVKDIEALVNGETSP